jgi:methanogenic corrinoid protein MtbC1
MEEGVFERRYGINIGTGEYDALRGRMKATLLKKDDSASAELAEELARGSYPLAFLYLEVLTPALRDITDEWHDKNRPFTDVDTAWDQFYVMLPILRRRLMTAQAGKPPIFVACVEGNEHELGARILADLLREAGYQLMYASAPTERRMLLDEVNKRNPACVVLSVSMPNQLDELYATVAGLRDKGYAGRIAAGGYAFEAHPAGWEQRGIDWIGADPLEFIAWLDHEVGAKREAA